MTALLISTGGLLAQNSDEQEYEGQQTLLGGGITSSGGYGGPMFQYGLFNGELALFTGGYGAWFANQKFSLGGGGFQLSSAIPVAEGDRLDNSSEMTYDMSYGGLYLGYTFASDKVIHPEITMFAGSGSVWQENTSGEDFGESSFALLQPGAQIDINVIQWMRVGVGANYRLAFGSSTPGLTDARIGGPSAYFTLKFGYFGY
ncbi:MAG TPA: hypothetical protein DCE41_13885 [Cytophagales bacterium]|nr:hypothetical protein [Cytophagales bacterium]HAA17396.1 hypothetical protein [Cytophagales bacterium]HAP62024.1 hypothetical protein [Cytophagales bacterium]